MSFRATVFCMICRDLARYGRPSDDPCKETSADFEKREDAEAWARREERGHLEGDFEIEELTP